MPEDKGKSASHDDSIDPNSEQSPKDLAKEEVKEKVKGKRLSYEDEIKKHVSKSASEGQRTVLKDRIEPWADSSAKAQSSSEIEPDANSVSDAGVDEAAPEPTPAFGPEAGVQSKAEPKFEANTKPLAPESQPVNPFELPPKEHESRYKGSTENSNLKKDLESEEPEEVEKAEEDSDSEISSTSEDDDKPVNPFASSKSTPFDRKPLEKKPLDRITDSDTKKEEKEEDKTPEKIGTAKERTEQETEATDFDNSDGEVAEKQTDVVDTPVEGEIVGETFGEQKSSPLNAPAAVAMEVPEENFWEMLENIGITKKRILWVFIIFVVLIVVGIFTLFGGNDSDDVKPLDKEVTEDQENEEDIEYSDAYGLISSYIFGLEFTAEPTTPIVALPITTWGSNSGIEALFYFGRDYGTRDESFIYYVELLEKLQNIYSTDVYKLLDNSVDRRAALEAHLKEMDSLITDSLEVYEYLIVEMARLDSEFEVLVGQKDLFETEFFNDLQSLHASNSYDNLINFIDDSKTTTEMKAYYNSYKLLREMYVNSINALRPRYEDIEANTEALVKGIRVFDIPASDIDAIIRLEQ